MWASTTTMQCRGGVYQYFYGRRKDWNVRAVLEQRTRLTPTKFRIPDVSIFRRDTPVEQVFTRPQLIAIEVLSPEDRHSKVQKRIEDFIKFQVLISWVVDPQTREGWDCSTGNWVRKERFEVVGTPIYLSLNKLFNELDAEDA